MLATAVVLIVHTTMQYEYQTAVLLLIAAESEDKRCFAERNVVGCRHRRCPLLRSIRVPVLASLKHGNEVLLYSLVGPTTTAIHVKHDYSYSYQV